MPGTLGLSFCLVGSCGQIFVEESGGDGDCAQESESLGQNHICSTC